MSLRLLPAAGRSPSPWKNGGGSTTEVAVWPPGAGLDDFDWRVSMADVEASGPFSAFPEIDRTLCLLSGAGMTLHIAGAGEVSLTAASPLCRFAGDAVTSAELHAGPIADLNVMTRRDRFAHGVERRRLVGGSPLAEAAFTLVLARNGGVTIASAGGEFPLGPGDAALLTGARGRIAAPAPAEIFVVRFDPA